MFWFAFASLLPALSLGAAGLWGGGWIWGALAAITLCPAGMDGLWPQPRTWGQAGPAPHRAERLLAGLALAHLALVPVMIRAISMTHDPVGGVGLALAWGMFMGQIAHPAAHELIHRPSRWLRWLGRAVYTAMLFGHHGSAHLKVHHVAVATPDDPNSPRRGEGFYRFWARAWWGSFVAGWRAERRDRARRARPGPLWRQAYVGYVGGAMAVLALAWGLAGIRGVGVLMAVAGYAQMQILLADYVQHYGLQRRKIQGRYEPVGPQHSWNARPWYSGAMMLNAPRHSDHHQNPGRVFPELRLSASKMPMLPRSMPVMCALALVPPLWRRVMDPRAAVWRLR